jgi:equilibrative nucleoside transporter 1/2/3
MLDRARELLGGGRRRTSNGPSEYEPLTASDDEFNALESSAILENTAEPVFSPVEYGIFALLGVAMLWAWYVPLTPLPSCSSTV